MFNLDFGDFSRAILDIGTALEIHLPSLIENYKGRKPELVGIDLNGLSVYQQYDRVLNEITGHTLHEEPSLFTELEYIRQIWNSITHNWLPEFRITKQFENQSRYIDEHIKRIGQVITEKHEVVNMRKNTEQI